MKIVRKALRLNTEIRMTEDDVVLSIRKWLISQGWIVTKCCTGRQRGNDIEATKGKRKLIVEAKGAKGKLPVALGL
jgi:hypothetical protein